MNMTGKVALLGKYCVQSTDLLSQACKAQWNFTTWDPGDGDVQLESALEGAQAVVVAADALLSGRILEQIRRCATLRLFQVPFSGHEWLKAEMLPPGCVACNVYTHGSAIAEYVMAAMLHHEINLTRIDADFRSGSWRYAGSAAVGERHGELAGKTVGLIGYGDIGEGIARRAAAFNTRVIAIARTPKTATAPLAWRGTRDELPQLLAESDYVVLACPLTPETYGLIDAEAFAQMKSAAVLINVARGPVVDQHALFHALTERRIGGAIVDTWYNYPNPSNPAPSPADLPFENLERLVMTPHCAAWSEANHRRRWIAIANNLDCLANNDPLNDLISFS